MIRKVLLFYLFVLYIEGAQPQQLLRFIKTNKPGCLYKATLEKNQYVKIWNPGYPRVTARRINCYFRVQASNPSDKIAMRCKLKSLRIRDRRCK